MTPYNIALFFHLVGVIVIFIAFGVGQRAGSRLRESTTVDHARLWHGLLDVTTPMLPTAWVLLLGSGLFMTSEAWTFATSWVATSIVALIGVGGTATVLSIRGFKRMGRALDVAIATDTTPEIRSLLADPSTWTSLTAFNGLSLALLWLMAVKPGWLQSTLLAAVFTIGGGLVGLGSARRTNASNNGSARGTRS